MKKTTKTEDLQLKSKMAANTKMDAAPALIKENGENNTENEEGAMAEVQLSIKHKSRTQPELQYAARTGVRTKPSIQSHKRNQEPGASFPSGATRGTKHKKTKNKVSVHLRLAVRQEPPSTFWQVQSRRGQYLLLNKIVNSARIPKIKIKTLKTTIIKLIRTEVF